MANGLTGGETAEEGNTIPGQRCKGLGGAVGQGGPGAGMGRGKSMGEGILLERFFKGYRKTLMGIYVSSDG